MNASSHGTKMMEGHPSDISQVKNSLNSVFWMTVKFGGSGVTVWVPGLILALIIFVLSTKKLIEWGYIEIFYNQMTPSAHQLVMVTTTFSKITMHHVIEQDL